MPDACYTSLSPSHEENGGNESENTWIISEDAMARENDRPVLCELAARLVNNVVGVASGQSHRPYAFPTLRALPLTQLLLRHLCAKSE